MRVLIFHGYLLRGTGSNVYNASLAQTLARLGHEVHLLCQDRDAAELDWVDRVGRWQGGALRFEGDPGPVTAYIPEIGGLLPVFVPDEYEGFRVKTFAELTDDELDAYLEANVDAVGEVVERLGGVDASLANHLVMGPVILARAGLRYALKVHGSDLSYTVLQELDHFRPYAEEAVDGAAGVLVGSAHIADRLREAVGDRADHKLRLGPPGVDAALFAPIDREAAPKRLRELAADVARAGGAGKGPDHARSARMIGVCSGDRTRSPSAWGRDTDQAANAIDWFADAAGPSVVFVGKLIVSKGVDLLLAAWPLVHAEHPGGRLLIAGFGEFEDGLRRLSAALEEGDLATAREIAARGRGLEGGEDAPLAILSAFLDALPRGYLDAAEGAAGSVRFAGRLEHDEVGALVPAAEALVFPSTFPEAFGMVAAEAAAAGVLPVSAAHSGALEVSRELAARLEPEAASLISFEVGPGAVGSIAARLNGWLSLPEAARERARAALSDTASALWSWERVARGVLAASAGRLDEASPVRE